MLIESKQRKIGIIFLFYMEFISIVSWNLVNKLNIDQEISIDARRNLVSAPVIVIPLAILFLIAIGLTIIGAIFRKRKQKHGVHNENAANVVGMSHQAVPANDTIGSNQRNAQVAQQQPVVVMQVHPQPVHIAPHTELQV